MLSWNKLPSDVKNSQSLNILKVICIVLYCLYLYPGFYSYTEGATWKILDLFTETLLI